MPIWTGSWILPGAYGLYVIEDNAQALGADYTSCDGIQTKGRNHRSHGNHFLLSLQKTWVPLETGEPFLPGMIALGNKLRSLVNHGMSNERYYYDQVGVNSRLDTMQAAILRVKLKHLDEYHHARQKAAAYYDQALSELKKFRSRYAHPFPPIFFISTPFR